MAGVLTNLSDALANTVVQASPGVVRVEGRPRLGSSGIVWSSDGVIVTAYHALQKEDELKVGLPNGQAVSATLIGQDASTDLAVLRVQSALSPLVWSDLADARVGHLVLALGRPGEGVRATLGVVSALGDAWVTSAGGRIDRYLQTDVVMYPGFSGGPLVDSESRVLGVNTSALSRGVSMTVPTVTVRRIVETLLAHGTIKRGYFGVGTQPVRLTPAMAKQFNQEIGLLIVSLAQNAPAEKGGLLLGDIILSLAGKPARSVDDMISTISGAQAGEAMQVGVIRGGQRLDIKVTVGEHP
jgi:S1-C subfamily serine protease